MSTKAAQFSNDQRTAAREQITINTRLTSLQCAQDMMKVNAVGEVKAEDLIAYADKIAEYILKDIESVKKPSAIIVQNAMPPKGVFKPGQQ